MDTKSFQALFLKALTENGTFEGKLAVYGNVDEAGEVIDAGAFTKTLREGGGQVPLCWQHDTAQPIGTLQLTDSPQALLCKGRLVLSVPQARNAYDLVMASVVKGLSIGYMVIKDSVDGNIRRLKELKLYEGSLVTLACNPLAQVTGVKRVQPDLEALDAFRNAARDLKEFHRRMIDGD